MNINKTIGNLRRHTYSSKYLNYSYWENECENKMDAVFKCKLCRRFKNIFLRTINQNSWNIKNIDQRFKEIEYEILTFKYSKISELPKFSDKQITLNFWIFRGWNEEEAKEKIKKNQKNNSQKFIKKRKANPEKYKSVFNTNIEYYIKRGHVDPEKALSDRQRTFTLGRCIQKYGDIEGREIFKNRQIRWQETLQNKENIDIINKRKDSNSMNYCIKKLIILMKQ